MAARAKLQAVDRATKYHPVSVAISKAKAAAWLLGELQEYGELASQLGVGSLTVPPDPRMPLPPSEIHAWLTEIASDALVAGLAEAQEEFNKSQVMPNGEGGA